MWKLDIKCIHRKTCKEDAELAGISPRDQSPCIECEHKQYKTPRRKVGIGMNKPDCVFYNHGCVYAIYGISEHGAPPCNYNSKTKSCRGVYMPVDSIDVGGD